MGYTLTAVRMDWNEERVEVDLQQLYAPPKDFRVGQRANLRTVLAEITAANLAAIYGGISATTAAGAGQKGYFAVSVGFNPVVTQYIVGLEGWRADSNGAQQPVRYFIYRATLVPDQGPAFDKRNPSGLPIMVKAFGDESRSAGDQLMSWQVVTAPSTS
jgi:hypothetical protein